MKRYCVTYTALQKYVRRNTEYAKLDYPGLDSLLRNIVPYINSINGIQTVFSCSGHLEKSNPSFYIVLAVTEQGYESFIKLFEKIDHRLNTINLFCSFSLRIQSLKINSIFNPDDTEMTKIFILEATFINKKQQTLFFDIWDRYIFEEYILKEVANDNLLK